MRIWSCVRPSFWPRLRVKDCFGLELGLRRWVEGMLWSWLWRYFQYLVSFRVTGNGLMHEHLPFNGSSTNFQKNDVPSRTGLDSQLDKLIVADHGLQKGLTINQNMGATRCATVAIDANKLYRAWRDQLDQETI